MKVLSLFDGISCGMVALERAGIPVERYVAYEIEPNAIKISKKNYPQIEHCGDVTTADFTQYEGFDLLLAGFPCQDLSINKSDREGLKGSRSGLFWQAVRAIHEANPRFFLIENNWKMPAEDCRTITNTLGVEPILIDSSLVSGQQRKRLYWTNIKNICQPQRKHINVFDIIETANTENLINEVVFNGKESTTQRHDKPLRIGTIGKGGQGERVYSIYGKSVTITANGGGRGAKTGLYLIDDAVRKLTPLEAERLQNLPDNYTNVDGITPTNRYKTVGNGWTVDVIAHILSYIPKEEREEKEMELKVKTPTFPEVIEFNFQELKQEITERATAYVNLVYTDDQIQDAKKDRASLNKFVKALSDERIKIKKECLKPYEDFEAKIKELDGIVGKAIKNIDDQVKGYEEKKKAEKREEIESLWMCFMPPFPIKLEQIFDEKWLNATVSMKSIQTQMEELIAKVETDLATIENLPEFSFEAKVVYKTTLDLGKAIQEGHRLSEIQKQKAEEERLKAEAEMAQHMNPPVEEPVQAKQAEPQREWIRFEAFLTTEDAMALKEFFISRGIPFEAI